jgi:pimeloyl-ACP methyl ester carboxylesterase
MKTLKKSIKLRFTKALFLTLGLGLFLTSCSKDEDPIPSANSKTYVLVHGAWQAAYSWKQVKLELEKRGNKVIAVDLPGHGDDNTDPSGIHMESYKAKVVAAIQAEPGKVVLVGHSMGGMVVSITAEAIPSKIERVIYVGAFIPKDGQSLLEVSGADKESLLSEQLELKGLLLGIKNLSLVPKLFAEDATEDLKKELSDKYRADPFLPFNEHVALSNQNFGSVIKSYIRTTKDLAIGITLQNQMIKDAKIIDIRDIASSHCPQLSKPVELTNILIAISK